MRQARNNPEKSSMHINDYRIASLDALGFDWNSTIKANKKEKKKKRRKEVDNEDDNLWIWAKTLVQ